MILEIAQIDVKPGTEAQFEAGVRQAVPLFERAKGCKGMALQRSHEKPQRYRLFVRWETIENHTVDFRGSTDFEAWRKLVADCFVAARRRARNRGGEGVLIRSRGEISRPLRFAAAPRRSIDLRERTLRSQAPRP
jgi:heme-degrading monooxygenase HmoA